MTTPITYRNLLDTLNQIPKEDLDKPIIIMQDFDFWTAREVLVVTENDPQSDIVGPGRVVICIGW